MRRIFFSSLLIVAVTGLTVAGTGAFFSDSETSTGNVFTAGAVNLQIDHAAASYNGESCEINCVPTGGELIVNGGFEDPALNPGAWQIYPTSIPGWEVTAGSGIEIQNNADGAPYEGQQLAELDSFDSSAIAQTITTVPGERYRLSFWYSPRPNRPAGDNTIGFDVLVESGGATIVSGTVGAGAAGGSNTSWTEYTYEFIAVDGDTVITFVDEGTSNTFGGYLDAVSVVELECTDGVYENTPDGFCELWEQRDLTTERFFEFGDVKPDDTGENLISLHVEDNEAYVCLATGNVSEPENNRFDPELAAGDTTEDDGELGEFLMVAGWYSDENGNQLSPLFPPTAVRDLDPIAYADSTTAEPPVPPGETRYVELQWCLGDLDSNGTCDGTVPDINQVQSDAFLADLQFYAVQSRNNGDFTCANLDLGGDDDQTDEPTVVTSNSSDWSFFAEVPTGSGSYVTGPGTTPLGSGSVQLTVDDTGRQLFGTTQFVGTRMDEITTLSYQSYRGTGTSALAPSLQFEFDDDTTDGDTSWKGRLVYEPYYTETVQTGVWQEWDTLTTTGTGNWWFSSWGPGQAFCSIGNPCTFAEVLAQYPDAGIRDNGPGTGGLIFKAGGPWTGGFSGNVDDFTIGINGTNQTFDFEN